MVPYLGWLWLASIGFYATVLLAAGFLLGSKQPRRVIMRIPVVFAAIHFGFAWGFWKEVYRQLRMNSLLTVPRTHHSILR
jgi:hypothetical protein